MAGLSEIIRAEVSFVRFCSKRRCIKMTKIDIISGFLGAGKTTLIKKLLQDAFKGQQIVLIENEFGEIGIDGGFLKDAGVEITEMNSGCICCTLVGDFSKALKEVLEKYHPDRIIIEPSGVGKLSDVAKAIEGMKADNDIVIDGRLTVVDGKKAKLYMQNFGEFYNNQVEYASTIIVSRTQMMNDKQIEECVHLLREKNEHAPIISTPWDELGKEAIMRAFNQETEIAEFLDHDHHHDHDECGCGCHDHDHEHEHHHDHDEECGCGCHDHEHEHEHHHDHDHCCHDHDHDHEHEHEHHYDEHGVCSCGHHHHGHDADEVFTSWGMETPKKFAEAEIKTALEALDTGAYGAVLRAKGIVPCTDGSWLHFDMVPGEIELRRGSADYTGRLCVIGSQLKEGDIQTLFQL